MKKFVISTLKFITFVLLTVSVSRLIGSFVQSIVTAFFIGFVLLNLAAILYAFLKEYVAVGVVVFIMSSVASGFLMLVPRDNALLTTLFFSFAAFVYVRSLYCVKRIWIFRKITLIDILMSMYTLAFWCIMAGFFA